MKENNKWKYQGDSRYEKVYEKMQLLSIQDITSDRQHKNGTIVWKLPIKNYWPGNQKNATCIEVASFKTGYVRNQGKSTRSNFQLNKRIDSEPEFFDSGKKDSMSRPLYTQWTTRTCKLIPIEIDRLEYLISYCLKNYYIKNANRIADGDYVPKWRYDNLADAARLDYDKRSDELDAQHVNDGIAKWRDSQVNDCGHYDRIRDLENKLDRIKTFLRHEL